MGAQGEGAAEISQACAHLLKNISLLTTVWWITGPSQFHVLNLEMSFIPKSTAWVFSYCSILDSHELANELKATHSSKNEDSSSFQALILSPPVPCCMGSPISQLIASAQHCPLTVYCANSYATLQIFRLHCKILKEPSEQVLHGVQKKMETVKIKCEWNTV